MTRERLILGTVSPSVPIFGRSAFPFRVCLPKTQNSSPEDAKQQLVELCREAIARLSENTDDSLLCDLSPLLPLFDPLAEQFGGDLTPSDLMSLPRYMAYCRLLVDGMPSKPFSMKTLPPVGKLSEDRIAIVRRVSRRRYARPLAQVTTELEQQLRVAA